MGFLSEIIEGKTPNLSKLFDMYIKNNMND